MPSDYSKIRKDNIREYGEGTRHLSFLGQLYTDRTHFIFELLQNAEDAGASKILFKLLDDRLEVSHDGRLFDERDVRGICGVGEGTKAEDLTQIGKFGIGFKSVYAYTSTPEVHSGDENFCIENYVRPRSVERKNIEAPWTTLFVFRFDAKETNPETAYQEIGKCLRNLSARTLLFLRKIKEIEYKLPGDAGVYLREEISQSHARGVAVIGQNNGQDEDENWLIFERPVTVPDESDKVHVEVGFQLETNAEDEKGSIKKINDAPLVVYFPTEKATRLGFLIQGPYRTTPARDNIPEDDGWNKKLVEETAELVVESLRQLKEMDSLSVSLLEALPIRADDFPENRMFYPIFSRVREALLSEELLPADDGTFVAASNAKLARGGELRRLLNQDQLHVLSEELPPDDDETFIAALNKRMSEPDGQVKWLDGAITQDRMPDLYSYLIRQLDVEEIDSDRFARKLSGEFLSKQTDEWFISFYQFLSAQKALWRRPRWSGERVGILQNKPILRLQDGTHVTPFPSGSPRAYLVTKTDMETSLPIVKATLSSDKEARKFLQELGVPELDIVEEVIGKILPKYTGASATVGPEANEHDLKKIERAYKTDSAEKKNRLRDALRKTPFILAECPNQGRRVYRKPGQVYFSNDELRAYFSGNDSFAFVNMEHPNSKLFRELGVSDRTRIRCKSKSRSTEDIHLGWADAHRRGLKGFDPDISVDGLENALRNPSTEKSRIIWNRIATDYSHCVRGRIIRSSRQDFSRSASIYEEKEMISESFGRFLIDRAWLPNSDGHFHKPNELTLDDLPESFDRYEKLADQLGMKKNVVAKLAEEAGISENVLNRAKQIEDAPPEIQKQIDSLLQKEDKKKTQQQESLPYAKALSETFPKPEKGRMNNNSTGGSGGFSPNPSRRREKTSEDIAAAIENEGAPEERSFLAVGKKWNGKNNQIRVDFVEWYGGQCQICKKTFTQRNRTPYFEGLYLVSHTTAEWIDRVGNVLCLCPWHSAMFQFGPKEVEEDIIQQVMRLKVEAEGGDGHPTIRMKLCGEPVGIEFAEKHLIDLQEMVKKSQESEYNSSRVPSGHESSHDA